MILTTVTLRIFFYGLVAFTPDQFVSGGFVRALLVDASRPPAASDGCPIHVHTPVLFHEHKNCQAPCRFDRGLCRCDLKGGNLLDIPNKDGEKCLIEDEKHPENSELNKARRRKRTAATGAPAGSDFNDFVPKMSSMRFLDGVFHRMRLREDCDQPCPSQQQPICGLIAAQINFHPRDVAACTTLSPPLIFRPLASTNLMHPNDQKTAEIVVFEVPFEAEGETPTSIELQVTDFLREGAFKTEVPVFKIGDGFFADIVAANIMKDEAAAYDRCKSDFIARDFELFHDLASSPIHPSDRPVPQAAGEPKPEYSESALCKDSSVFKILEARILHAGKTRPICPEAALEGVN